MPLAKASYRRTARGLFELQGLTEPEHWNGLAEACVGRCTELAQDALAGVPGPETITRIDQISDDVSCPAFAKTGRASAALYVLRLAAGKLAALPALQSHQLVGRVASIFRCGSPACTAFQYTMLTATSLTGLQGVRFRGALQECAHQPSLEGSSCQGCHGAGR